MNSLEDTIAEIRAILKDAEAGGKSGYIKISLERGQVETITEKERRPRQQPSAKPKPPIPATAAVCPHCHGDGETEITGHDCILCLGKGWIKASHRANRTEAQSAPAVMPM